MNLLAAFVVISIVAPVQDGMTIKPSPQLRKMAFLIGTWKGGGEMHGMGSKPQKVSDTMIVAPTMQGMWLEERHKGFMGKQLFMEGRQFTTYDDQAKKWKAWWFDNAGPFAMEMTGDYAGNDVVMTSSPITMPGMSQPMITRSTLKKISDRKIQIRIEMKVGDKWAPMISSVYTKVGK
jgi:hypothetical protein